MANCPDFTTQLIEHSRQTRATMEEDIVATVASELMDGPRSAISSVMDILNPDAHLTQQQIIAKNEWKNRFPNSREAFHNDDRPYTVYGNIKKDIEARYAAFKSDADFSIQCNANIDATMDHIKDKEKDDFNRLKKYMETYLASYKSLFNYKASMSMIIHEKMNKLHTVKNKTDTYKQNLFMDNRKDNYQQKNYDFYKSIHFFTLIVYYSIFVLYLIFSNFFKDTQYKNKFIIFLMILYLVFPFILKYFLHYIYMAYIYILEYNNLREEVISYPYIIGE